MLLAEKFKFLFREQMLPDFLLDANQITIIMRMYGLDTI